MLPLIVVQPIDRSVAEGQSTTFYVGLGQIDSAIRFQWRRDGAEIPGANSSSYTIAQAGAADSGRYACDVLNDETTEASEIATLTVIPAAQPSRFANFSVVASLDTPSASATIEYAVGGAGTAGEKPVLVRAVGPSLARFGMAHRNAEPKLELFAGGVKTGQQERWGGAASVVEAAARVGAFPLVAEDSADAAVLLNAAPSTSRALKISGRNGATGVVLAEVYDATPVAALTMKTPRLINFSVLESVAPGASLSVGFVITGQSTKTVLVRVVGPSLANENIDGLMTDPALTILSDATPIAANDNWSGRRDLTVAANSVGAFPLNPSSKDAAVLLNLPRGSYAVQASDARRRGGIVLVEIYEVP